MNTAFLIVCSHARQAFVVTDEHTDAHGKCSGTRRIIAGLGLSLLAGVVHATPLCSGPTTTISTATSSTCNLGAGDSLIVTETGSLSSTDSSAVFSDAGFGSISNAGSIVGGNTPSLVDDIAIQLQAGTGWVFGTSVINLEGASIQGSEIALHVDGSTHGISIGSIDNKGSIDGYNSAGGGKTR